MISPTALLWNDQRGAVAVSYALALTALVAVGGVGYDYTRMMALDTELQNAADQAALAAATQLDGRAGSIDRAKDAVNSYFAKSTATEANRTVMANDGNGTAVSGVTFTFYDSFNTATDTPGTVTTSDTAAKVVRVDIGARRAVFALTPIVGLFNSGDMTAAATAGVQSGTCKLPPLLICGPVGNPDFPTAADVGKGLLLKLGAGSSWSPGNFGYVDFGAGSTAVKDLLGNNSASDNCLVGSDVKTQPGNIASATDYLNTRFDIYTASLTKSECLANGDKCPAYNTRKDVVIKEVYTFAKVDGPALAVAPATQTYPAAPARPACGAAAPTGGSKTADTDWSLIPQASWPSGGQVGFPRDIGVSAGTIGNGQWDVTGYYNAHGYLPAGLTHRWDIYKWERDNAAQGLQPSIANYTDGVSWEIKKASGSGNADCKDTDAKCGYIATWTNYCSYPQPINGIARTTAKDRRVLTVAVAACEGKTINGSTSLPVNKWMDIFLTEPSLDRSYPAVTSRDEIYGEIIGPATRPDGTNGFQYYSRQKVVLFQ